MIPYNLFIHAALVFIGSLLLIIYLIPKVIKIVNFKNIMDNPNMRSSHAQATPSLGGVAFYFVIIISFYFNQTYDTSSVAINLIPALTILFFLGLKDDLLVLDPLKKFIGQIVASLFILVSTKFEVNSFHGFLFIEHINYWVGMPLSLFAMLAITNAFNLIDGIDGLAAALGIVVFSSFTLLFFWAECYFFALTALTMIGILVGFLYFNLSNKKKIFMGDTGSMLIGFMVSAMSVRVLSLDMNSLSKLPFNPIDIPILLLSFVIMPFLDTTRVIFIRILQRKSPFSADRNHIHHVFIDTLNISHRRASFYIACLNMSCILLFAAILKWTNNYIAWGSIILFVLIFLYWLHKQKVRLKSNKQNQADNISSSLNIKQST